MTIANYRRPFLALVGTSLLAVMVGCGAGVSYVGVEVPAFKSNDSETDTDTNNGPNDQSEPTTSSEEKKMEIATFAAGCYWCVEAVFQKLKGVENVRSGFMGGKVKNPTYRQVVSGLTGHAEVIQFEFDPDVISFAELLEVFWTTHDPTTLNRQGNDIGTQYRSAVFFHNEQQQQQANKYKKQLNAEKAFRSPIVTEVTQASEFYEAEDYHQNYFNNNPNQPYCRALIPPKLEKLKKVFGDKLR